MAKVTRELFIVQLIGGAFIGTIIGGTAGFFWRTDKWMPVSGPQPAITLNPAR
jgi:hypothetical protein